MQSVSVIGLPALVLFDRDGTLIEDVPAIVSASEVVPMPGALAAVKRLHGAGIAVGVITNQPRLEEGSLSQNELEAIHARIDELFGPVAVWAVCPHSPATDCACRKPKPGGLLRALGACVITAAECVVIGDIGSDVEAAQAAGARSILVPTPVTRPDEVAAATVVARDIEAAVELVLQGLV